MTTHESAPPVRAGGQVTWWLLGGIASVLLVLAGCIHTQPRAKVADEGEVTRYDLPTIGDKTVVGQAQPLRLAGIGLVEGLDGTGGDCARDSYRAMLADELRKAQVPHVERLLTSPDCALVLVEATIPAGSVKDDKIDVEVKLPPGSRATSLRGGVLRKCALYDYDYTQNLNPGYTGPQGTLRGHKRAEAKGAILTGDDSAGAKQGRIWQGAECKSEQPIVLVMNPDSQQARLTALIMERINATYVSGPRSLGRVQVAHTANNLSVTLRVPSQYRHNLPRFLRVVRAIPLSESLDAPLVEGDDKRPYRQKIGDDLLDPARTLIAALRLEALGDKSVPALKLGLLSPHPLVRFASAEALAYLGSAAGCEELGRAVASYPKLRAFALTALASLDESASVGQLKQAVNGDCIDEARTGAYRALWLMNPRDPMVRGEWLSDSFYLNAVAPEGKPLIFVSTMKRAEVVFFGQTPPLVPPFSLLAGEFTITATPGSVQTMVSWVPRGSEQPVRRSCGLQADEIIRTMADMGGGFNETLTFLQQACNCDAISCPLRIDSLPEAGEVKELHLMGKDGTAEEFLPAGAR